MAETCEKNRKADDMKGTADKRSFILGMITAFSECVAGGCKRLALSPPLQRKDYEMVAEEAYHLIEKHGLLHYHEENLDQPETERFEWILIAGNQETIDQYLAMRRQGYSPVCSLEPFRDLLSYRQEESIHTGYDAYRDYFPEQNAPGKPELKMNYTYLLRCADGTLYCGWTNDPEKRLAAHNAGTASKYTASRRPVKLVYLEAFKTKQEAMKREAAIKRLSRKGKLKLIEEKK